MKNTRFFSKVSGTLVSLSVLACDAGSVESTDPAEKMTFRDYPSVCDDFFSEAEIQTIKFDQELLVKRKTVVTDPCRTGWTQLGCGTKLGKWTAWQHFTVLAGGGDPSVFIHDWFKTFFVPSEVNGQMLTKRNLAEKVLIGWRKQSMGPNCLVPENLATPCSLDKNKAPFRLLAVVNRQDVRGDGGDPDSYGGPLGEGRFVFNILKYDAQNQLKKSKANVIFEYNLPSIWKDPFSDAWEWANRWHKLASAPMQADDEVYKQQLQTKITDVFATANNLAQVRSEEIDFDPNEGLNRVWSFREYELRCPTPQPCNAAQKRLMPRTVTLTPNSDHNKGPNANTSLFATWFKSPGVIDSVLDGTPEVPLKIGDTYFRGAESLAGEATNSAFRTLWGAKLLQDNTLDVITVDGIVPYKARHQFGVTTCNGCHYDETDTSMMFIRERDAAVESQLADFLKTSTAEGETHNFTMFGFSSDDWYLEFNEPRRRACEMLNALDGNPVPLTRNNGSPH